MLELNCFIKITILSKYKIKRFLDIIHNFSILKLSCNKPQENSINLS